MAAAPASVGRPALIEPDAIRDAGLRVVVGIDAGKVGELWDGGSAMLKRDVARDAFMANIASTRKGSERPTARDWIAIHRAQGGGTLPAGQYASVQFATTFAGGHALREILSFRLDDDGVWRFVGYAVE
ncbi:DUF4019 domain-containing protein [Pseudomonas sp. CGJS7]|uniref:DUF4019 domain-containing protein n=1 Tax=Pseudomonas sp. CGJS7 TaxID=3109348 RepID=UPI0030082C9D